MSQTPVQHLIYAAIVDLGKSGASMPSTALTSISSLKRPAPTFSFPLTICANIPCHLLLCKPLQTGRTHGCKCGIMTTTNMESLATLKGYHNTDI